MMTEDWEGQRRQKEQAARLAILDLFSHTGGAAAFVMQLDPNNPDSIMAAGPRLDVLSMLSLECRPAA